MAKLTIELEKIVEIREALGVIWYKTELISASVLMGEIAEQVKRIDKLLPEEKKNG